MIRTAIETIVNLARSLQPNRSKHKINLFTNRGIPIPTQSPERNVNSTKSVASPKFELQQDIQESLSSLVISLDEGPGADDIRHIRMRSQRAISVTANEEGSNTKIRRERAKQTTYTIHSFQIQAETTSRVGEVH